MKIVSRFITILFCALILQSCDKAPEDIGAPSWPEKMPKQLDFKSHVRPLLVINCIECHNSKDAAKYMGVNLQTKKAAFSASANGPLIVPGDPDNSLIIKVLARNPSHEWAMPPTPDRIWGVRLEILRRWIKEGAKWPAGLELEMPGDVDEW